jgi:sarcosine oxidase, subunit delta
MKILHCPLNGPRNISEFICLGELKPLPSPDAEPSEWAKFAFLENNLAGVVRERWMHIATNYIFVVERDTLSDAIIRTYELIDPAVS